LFDDSDPHYWSWQPLLCGLNNQSPAIQSIAAEAASLFDGFEGIRSELITTLRKLLESKDIRVRQASARSLVFLGAYKPAEAMSLLELGQCEPGGPGRAFSKWLEAAMELTAGPRRIPRASRLRKRFVDILSKSCSREGLSFRFDAFAIRRRLDSCHKPSIERLVLDMVTSDTPTVRGLAAFLALAVGMRPRPEPEIASVICDERLVPWLQSRLIRMLSTDDSLSEAVEQSLFKALSHPERAVSEAAAMALANTARKNPESSPLGKVIETLESSPENCGAQLLLGYLLMDRRADERGFEEIPLLKGGPWKTKLLDFRSRGTWSFFGQVLA